MKPEDVTDEMVSAFATAKFTTTAGALEGAIAAAINAMPPDPDAALQEPKP